MEIMVDYLNYYKGKTILVTGHTGFKGSWLSKILLSLGANVIGYSLEPNTTPNLFNLSNVEDKITSIIGDVRDYEKLSKVFDKYQPEIVIHLAAQPIVLTSYEEPRYTYEVNVMGTVNILECLRNHSCTKTFLNVTTDKVYENNDIYDHAFSEDEKLDGYDPYSNSKSCSELVTHSYKKSFFNEDNKCAISTARAGNVIGGGDFSPNRIIPDAVRSVSVDKVIVLRNPHSTRPYQHVLEPLFAYLMILAYQAKDKKYQGYYNIGPDEVDCVTNITLIKKFCDKYQEGLSYEAKNFNLPHEANFLKLDTSKIKKTFSWSPSWHIDEALDEIVHFTKFYYQNPQNIPEYMDKTIKLFMEGLKR